MDRNTFDAQTVINKYEFDEKKYRDVIKDAINNLIDGDTRLTLSNYPLSLVVSELEDEFPGDYYPISEKLKKEFYEEIAAITNSMIDKRVPIPLFDWQSKFIDTNTNKSNIDQVPVISDSLREANREIYAVRLWRWYGIPWRFQKNVVQIISPPIDYLDIPWGEELSIQDFVRGIAEELYHKKTKLNKIEVLLERWQTFGVSVMIIAILALWIWIT